MWHSLAAPLIAVVALCARVVRSEIVTINAFNTSITYGTTQNGDTGVSWYQDSRPEICPVGQQVTKKLGDFAKFSFKGTAIEVLGTLGTVRGIIQIDLDGATTTFDRSSEDIVCDATLFSKTGLPDTTHTITLTLLNRQAPLNGQGALVGLLSIQNIRYTQEDITSFESTSSSPTPSTATSSTASVATPTTQNSSKANLVGPIVGGVVGGLAIIAIVIIVLLWQRKRDKDHAANREWNANYDENKADLTPVNPPFFSSPHHVYAGTPPPMTPIPNPGMQSYNQWGGNPVMPYSPVSSIPSPDHQTSVYSQNSQIPIYAPMPGHRPMTPMSSSSGAMSDPRRPGSDVWSQAGSYAPPFDPYNQNPGQQRHEPWMDMVVSRVIDEMSAQNMVVSSPTMTGPRSLRSGHAPGREGSIFREEV